jgi:hypothetical protein
MTPEQKKRFLRKTRRETVQKILRTGFYMDRIPPDVLFMIFLQNLDEEEYTRLASNWFHTLYQGSVDKVIESSSPFQIRDMLSPIYTGNTLVEVGSVEELFDLKMEYLFLEEYFKRYGLGEILALLALEPEPLLPQSPVFEGDRVPVLEKRFNYGI